MSRKPILLVRVPHIASHEEIAYMSEKLDAKLSDDYRVIMYSDSEANEFEFKLLSTEGVAKIKTWVLVKLLMKLIKRTER